MSDLSMQCYGHTLSLEEWKEKFKGSEYLELKNVNLTLYNVNLNGDTREEKGVETLIIMPHNGWSPVYSNGWSGSSGMNGVPGGCSTTLSGVSHEDAEEMVSRYEEASYDRETRRISYWGKGLGPMEELMQREREERKKYRHERVSKISLNGMEFKYDEVTTCETGSAYTTEGARGFYVFRNNRCVTYYWVAGIFG